jgi:hypothetical protein
VEELEPRLTPAETGTNDFRISDMGPDGDRNSGGFEAAVAHDSVNNQYLVVWWGSDTTFGEPEIYGQLIDAATGGEIGSDFRISDMGPPDDNAFFGRSPAVAFNSVNKEYLVVWAGDDDTAPLVENEFEIFGQRVDAATGAEVGANDFRLSDMGTDGLKDFAAFDPAVAYNATNNEYLVVWSGDDTTNDETEIFGQRVDAATGVEIGANDFRISNMGPDGDANFDAILPAVAWNSTNNEYLVVWHGDDDTGELVDQEREIFGQRLSATGAELGTDFRLSDMGPDGNTSFNARSPAVAYNSASNEYLVVWSGDDDTVPLVDNETEVFGQRVSATGVEIGVNDFRVSETGPDGNASFEAFSPAVAYSAVANEYLVVWAGDDDTGLLVDGEFEIFGQRLDAAGVEIGTNDFRLSDMGPDGDTDFEAGLPAAAFNSVNNEYVVVWDGDDNTGLLVDQELEIYGQRFSPIDPPPPFPRSDPSQGAPPQIVAEAFRRRRVARVRVKDAATGTLRAVLTPFAGFGGRLRLRLVDVNGDGSLDLIVKAVIRGKRKQKVFDAHTLAPLPANLAERRDAP